MWNSHRRSFLRVVLVSGYLSACATACSAPPAEIPEEDCSALGQNLRVQQLMEDAYFWNDKVPHVDPGAYESPQALLDALVYKKLDRWSHITEKSIYDAYYEEGSVLGFGFNWRYDAGGDVRFSLIHAGSSAEEAGLMRGDKVTAIEGKSIEEVAAGDLWSDVLGEDKEGVKVTFTVEDKAGLAADRVLEKRWYALKTVHTQKVADVGGVKVGYLFFTNFIETSEAELRAAFASFKSAGVRELVLDLRYNGGGRLDIAALLGDLIAGPGKADSMFFMLFHNAKHHDWDGAVKLSSAEEALALSRVFVITSAGTASASETVINSLRPYVDVKTIGATTHGKPVGMHGWSYCDLVTVPISFEVLNAKGEGGYYEGLAPDCWADDLLTAAVGDETETSFAEALHLLQLGACSSSGAGAGAKQIPPVHEIPRRGFRMEVGSF